MIQYNGLTRAEILMVLYNSAKVDPNSECKIDTIDLTWAERILEEKFNEDNELYFVVLGNKCLNLDLSSDTEFDETLYNNINGENLANIAIDEYVKAKSAGLNC